MLIEERKLTNEQSKLAPLLSSVKMDWNTPPKVLNLVRELAGGPIGLDPCTDASNPCKAEKYFTPEEDGLTQSWSDSGLVYANPPYGREVGGWAKKFAIEGQSTSIVALLPARPDTRWFQSILTAQVLCFWTGRIKFVGAESAAPFPSVVAYWGNDSHGFKKIFGQYGWLHENN